MGLKVAHSQDHVVHAVISEQLFSLEMQPTLLDIHCWPNLAQQSFRAAGSVLRMTESPVAGAMILSSADVRTHAKRAAPVALGLVDAGLMAGHSFRVGWAPGGRLAHPGGAPRCCCRTCLSHTSGAYGSAGPLLYIALA